VHEVLFESHNKYVGSLKLLRLCVLEGIKKSPGHFTTVTVGGRVGPTVDLEFVEEKNLVFLSGCELVSLLLRLCVTDECSRDKIK
jgi:hypothetical protein